MVKNFYKIKGSVLIYVLIAIAIVSILITSLIVSISIRNRLNIPKRKEIQMLYTAESGNIFLVNKLVTGNKITFNKEINLREELSESFPELCSDYLILGNLHLQPGLFQISTKVSNNLMEKTVSQKFGINIYDNFKYAVYSNNRLDPLIISGEGSEIIGGASSPISIYEIEDAKIDLKSYSPKNLLPELNLELTEQINDYYQKIFNDDNIKWSGLEILNSDLKDKPVYIKSDVNIGDAEEINELPEGKIIYIKGSLRLTKGTKINNVDLIISENLYILDGSALENINIICFGEVLINGENHFKNCYIQSTEILIISGKSEFNNTVIYQTNIRESGIIKGKIDVSGETKINGFIISSLPGKFDKDDKVRTEVKVSKDVYINGGIINYGTTNFQGTLDGILYSGDFSDGKNKNYLKNVRIDINKMDKNIYLPLYFKNLKPKVIEWKVY